MVDIISVSELKGCDNKRFLMKQKEITTALHKLFYNQKIKWHFSITASYVNQVSITHLILSKDYKHVRAFLSPKVSAEGEIPLPLIVKTLNQEANTIRHYLLQELKLRSAPKIFFKEDLESAKISRLEALLDRIKQEQ